MERSFEVRAALLNLLLDLQAQDGRPIDLFEIGVPMVAKGFEQHEIAGALMELDRSGEIALIGGNRLQVRNRSTNLR